MEKHIPMPIMPIETALITFAYLLGSMSSAVLVCCLFKFGDPRTQGSKNPGATNVFRLYGKNAAALTLAGDVMKGVIPLVIGDHIGVSGVILAATGVAAFCGHLFPIFFRFKGGKGVATLIGVLFGFHWLSGLIFIATWLLVAAIFRYSSLAALVAALTAPLHVWALTPQVDGSVWLMASTIVMATLLFWRHRFNIRRLKDGEEPRINGVLRRNS